MSLDQYQQKRDFSRTPEPQGDGRSHQDEQGLRFVVQKHAASRLHYDFRLEIDGVLKSWAVPKGPSLDPQQRSLAVDVEDHPLEYGDFEGVIPQGEYGGGTVMVWDEGVWLPDADPLKQYRRGKLRFQLKGQKLRGEWTLVRMSGRGDEEHNNWLLIKRSDEYAKRKNEFDLLTELPNSVTTGRSMKEIAAESDAVWSAGGKRKAAKTAEPSDRDQAVSSASISQEASELSRAKKAEPPATLQPQLPTLVQEPPVSEGWIHELKLDGYRIMILLRDGKATLLTRGGKDWTERFSALAKEAEELPLSDAVIDGEIVSLRPDGTTDFQALQNALRHEPGQKLIFFAFDLPWCGGYDLRRTPLHERKALLRQCLASTSDRGRIRFTDHIASRGRAVFQHACRHSLEGIVSKRADSPYESGRSRSWLKVKCLKRQEFVVGGYSSPGGSRKYFGALLLGYHNDQGRLIYCGRVGTGFINDSLQELGEQLQQRASEQCPFDEPPEPEESRDVTWVEPELVAEVGFSQWTDDDRLRHASFQGLREDKQPSQITREQPATAPPTARERPQQPAKEPETDSRRATASSRSDTFFGIRLSNPGRVLYSASGYTKRDLAAYYAKAAEWILPHLLERPLTLVRCPRGQAEECFYQKHLTESFADLIQGVTIEDDNGEAATYIAVKDEAGLITLVQMGALEIHPWGARSDRLDRPDRLIFDLDPHEQVSWENVVDAAHELRELLEALHLVSFVRTTGGKGLHVVVPIMRRSSWDEAKQFTRDVAEAMVRHDPRRFIATASKAKRKGKIFIDYLRNSRGATAVASYSTRARSGATVATPIRWEELTSDLQPEKFDIRAVERRLRRQRQDPWQGFDGIQQSITKAATKVLRKRSA